MMINEKLIEAELEELRSLLSKVDVTNGDMIPLMKEAINNWTPEELDNKSGTVIMVGDGIATVSGMDDARYGEILIFAGGVRGMVQELKKGEAGCILFGDDREIAAGSLVKRTKKTAAVPVGEGFKGRVTDALGNP